MAGVSDGRMVWRTRDCGYLSREWIVTLGEEFGPVGVIVIDWLEDQAKLQNGGGRVKTGPRAIARACFTDAVTVGHVVSRAVTLGLLVDYEERDGRFECVISWFAADQGKAMAAIRKARQRSQAPVDPDDPPPESRPVTPGHAESPKVTLTVQDRTEEKNTSMAAAPPPDEWTEIVERLCSLMSEQVRSTHNVAASSKEGLVAKAWPGACRSLLTLDGYSERQVEYAIGWVCRHKYWSRRIKSMTRLRQEMAEVAKQIAAERVGGQVVPISGKFAEYDRAAGLAS